MEEITAGLLGSGVRFLLVAREEIKDCGDKGLVVPWCDQLKVLCHPSIGGFWSHCGWNSVREGIFAGTPFLTFPLFADQNLNSKLMVEDWKIGWRMKQHGSVTTREHISVIVKRLTDSESDNEVQQIRRRARELRQICLKATGRQFEDLKTHAWAICPNEQHVSLPTSLTNSSSNADMDASWGWDCQHFRD